MLTNCGSVCSIGGQDLVSPIDVILLYQLLFVLIEILSVWNLLLESFTRESSQKVLLQLRFWARGRSIVQVLEFRFPHQLMATVGAENLRVRD